MLGSVKFSPDRIGLIAGQGDFPVIFAEAARSLGKKVVVFGVEGCADARLRTLGTEMHEIGLGELDKLAELLKKTQVRHVVLAGGVPKKNFYDPSFRIDASAQKLVENTQNRGDDGLLRAFRIFLKIKCGVSVMDTRLFLKETTAPKGILTRRQPTAEEWNDLKFGWKIAKAVGRMDIGQTVVVKKRIVLAVEAIEGTDRAIERGALLGGGEAVVVKVSKPGQDLRFDLPCIGRQTLDSLKAGNSRVLGVEAGKTILLFREKLIKAADSENMTIVGM